MFIIDLHETQTSLHIRFPLQLFDLSGLIGYSYRFGSSCSACGSGDGLNSFEAFGASAVRLGGALLTVLLWAAKGWDGPDRRIDSARRRASTELPGVRYSGRARRLPPRLSCARRVGGSGRRIAAVEDKLPSGRVRVALSVDHSFSEPCELDVEPIWTIGVLRQACQHGSRRVRREEWEDTYWKTLSLLACLSLSEL